MKSLFSLQAKYLRFNLRANMEYKSSFLLQVFGMVLNNASFIVFWLIFLDKIGGDLGGYGFSDIMFLWSVGAVGFGLAVLFYGNVMDFSRIIYSGELDVYLLQPRPVLWNALSSKMIVSGLGDIIYGFSLFLFTATVNLLSFGLFLLFSILMALLFISVLSFYHSLTFFFGNSEGVARFATEAMISFSIYPGSVFQGPERFVLHSLIPVAWAAYIPLSIIREPSLSQILLVLGVDLGIVLFSIAFFYLGLRYYESGNRIGARV